MSWTPTPELRWHVQEVIVDPLNMIDRSTLQQKWINGRKSEWRNLPTFKDPETKVESW